VIIKRRGRVKQLLLLHGIWATQENPIEIIIVHIAPRVHVQGEEMTADIIFHIKLSDLKDLGVILSYKIPSIEVIYLHDNQCFCHCVQSFGYVHAYGYVLLYYCIKAEIL
jgi:hypothetical protein